MRKGNTSGTERIENLLRGAKDWEPTRDAPTGFAHRALRQKGPQRRKFALPVWALGSVGVAAAASTFVFTGRVAPLESAAPNIALVAQSSAPVENNPKTSAPTTKPDKETPAGKTAVVKPRVAPPLMRPFGGARRRYWAGRESGSRRISPRETEAQDARQASASLGGAQTPKAAQTIPSRPVQTIALDEQPVIVPVLYAEPSEDGTEVRVTPVAVAVGDVALQASAIPDDLPPGTISME